MYLGSTRNALLRVLSTKKTLALEQHVKPLLWKQDINSPLFLLSLTHFKFHWWATTNIKPLNRYVPTPVHHRISTLTTTTYRPAIRYSFEDVRAICLYLLLVPVMHSCAWLETYLVCALSEYLSVWFSFINVILTPFNVMSDTKSLETLYLNQGLSFGELKQGAW